MPPTTGLRAGVLVILLAAAARAQVVPPFAGPIAYDPGPSIFGFNVYAVDLDADGRADLVVQPAIISGEVRYRLSNRNGGLGPMFGVPVTGQNFGCMELGDGTADFVTLTQGACPLPSIGFYSNQGANCSQAPPLSVTSIALSSPCMAGGATINAGMRGNTIDLLFQQGGGAVPIQRTVEAGTITFPSGPGGAAALTPVGAPYVVATAISTGGSGLVVPCELDGDGVLDFVVATIGGLFGPATIEVVLQAASGPVLNPATPFIAGQYAVRVFAKDLTGDGRDELIVQDPFAPQATVWLNQGSPSPGGGILLSPLPSIAGWYLGAFGDVDGDGDVDAIGYHNSYASGSVGALLNDGLGTLAPPTTMIAVGTNSVAAGDLDGDGDLDVIVGGTSVLVFLNQLIPTPVTRPGTADAITLGSSVQPPGMSPAYSQAPFFDFKTASGNIDVSFQLSAPAFVGSGAYLLAELFATGCPPIPILSDVHVSGGPTMSVFGPLTIPASGELEISFPVSLGTVPQNLSAIGQFAIVSSSAANGAYATTEAHEIQF